MLKVYKQCQSLGIIIVVLFLICSNSASACTNPDKKFTMIISDIEINLDKLKNLCSQKTCTIDQDYIAIKSSYNPEVSLIMGNTGGTLKINGLMTKLPYKLDEICCQKNNRTKEDCYRESYCLTPSTIIPENYNWQESIKIDLNNLKNLGVANISEKDINDISSIANGSGIRKCHNEWQITGECYCDNLCPDCIGTAFLPILPAEKLLAAAAFPPLFSGGTVQNREKPAFIQENVFYFIAGIIGLVIIILIALMIYLVKKSPRY